MNSSKKSSNKGGLSAGAAIGMLAGAILTLFMLLGEFSMQQPEWIQVSTKILLSAVAFGLLIRFAISAAKDE